ncbi:MAG: hypothetical protein H7123_09385 [Thermoleophilia bacterium]|nr:hypothetical protein [Thermoleophilia bacterium]
MAHIICVTHSDQVAAGSVPDWARERGHTHVVHQLQRGDEIPASVGDVDIICVMGGPMGVYDAPTIPWLARELEWLRELVVLPPDERPLLVGICLGAQLLAAALGADVRLNRQREIGYWPLIVDRSHTDASWLTRLMPTDFTPFLWHQDTFDIPDNTLHVASTEACTNQAFTTPDGSIVGLQFHPEFTAREIGNLISSSCGLHVDAPFVQQPDTLAGNDDARAAMKQMLWSMLDQMLARLPADRTARDTLRQ